MKKIIWFVIAAIAALPALAAAGTPAAKVGGRIITVEELKKTINSTPYALPNGQVTSVPQKMLVLEVLANMIDAELLHADALANKVPASPAFVSGMNAFKRALLADNYRARLRDAVSASAAEIQQLAREKTLNEEAAKALIVNDRRHKALETEASRLFDAYKVKYVPTIATTPLSAFADDDILVSSARFSIYFRDVTTPLGESGNTKEALMTLLAQSVEEALFAAAAIEAGLDKGAAFKEAVDENARVLAIVIHRRNLEATFAPGKKQVAAFIKKNDYLNYKPQKAEVLLIVAKSEPEAASLRQRALKGENFYELAAGNSIAPNASVNAGRIAPLSIGERPYSSLDLALLGMKPGDITPPIKGDKGYSIFKLVSLSPRELRDTAAMKREAAQLLLDERMAAYLDKLRKGKDIVIYPAVKEL